MSPFVLPRAECSSPGAAMHYHVWMTDQALYIQAKFDLLLTSVRKMPDYLFNNHRDAVSDSILLGSHSHQKKHGPNKLECG